MQIDFTEYREISLLELDQMMDEDDRNRGSDARMSHDEDTVGRDISAESMSDSDYPMRTATASNNLVSSPPSSTPETTHDPPVRDRMPLLKSEQECGPASETSSTATAHDLRDTASKKRSSQAKNKAKAEREAYRTFAHSLTSDKVHGCFKRPCPPGCDCKIPTDRSKSSHIHRCAKHMVRASILATRQPVYRISWNHFDEDEGRGKSTTPSLRGDGQAQDRAPNKAKPGGPWSMVESCGHISLWKETDLGQGPYTDENDEGKQVLGRWLQSVRQLASEMVGSACQTVYDYAIAVGRSRLESDPGSDQTPDFQGVAFEGLSKKAKRMIRDKMPTPWETILALQLGIDLATIRGSNANDYDTTGTAGSDVTAWLDPILEEVLADRAARAAVPDTNGQ